MSQRSLRRGIRLDIPAAIFGRPGSDCHGTVTAGPRARRRSCDPWSPRKATAPRPMSWREERRCDPRLPVCDRHSVVAVRPSARGAGCDPRPPQGARWGWLILKQIRDVQLPVFGSAAAGAGWSGSASSRTSSPASSGRCREWGLARRVHRAHHWRRLRHRPRGRRAVPGGGASLTILDRDKGQLDDVVRAAADPARVHTVTADVRDSAAQHAAVAERVARFGRLDTLVASAGVWNYQRQLTRLGAAELDTVSCRR
ncbi:SDR family oxidoreductase [Streptomyces atratus]|uniref:SDR family oxidoreductase n=1 Tax=Streptomyces atratus TaxID=1893 RepID=UPI0038737C13